MEKVKYTRQEYREEYLRSDEWKKLRNLIMSTVPDCQCCGGKSSDVHHMTYRNIVDITVKDLIPVCRLCHDYIHTAIKDGYISQKAEDFDEIVKKTLNILNDETYKAYGKWLSSKHYLSDDEISSIQNGQAFIVKKIAGLVKRKVWYDNIGELKFTGRQIEKIRKIIESGVYRRKNKLDRIPDKLTNVNYQKWKRFGYDKDGNLDLKKLDMYIRYGRTTH